MTTPMKKVTIASDAQRIILSEVRKFRYTKSINQGVMIPCPFHKERHPSMIITLTADSKYAVGSYKCFGCGVHGGWNSLAEKMGLRKTSQYDRELSEFAGLFLDESGLSEGLTIDKLAEQLRIEFVLEWGAEKWRGTPPELMRGIGAREGLNDKGARTALLPVYVGDELQGGIAAAWKRGDKDTLSYVSSPGAWVQTHGLFPFDYSKKLVRKLGLDAIAITEGPRDALRLIRNGIPAVAIMGTQNWSDVKRGLVLSAASNPVIIMDGDKAGRIATQKIKESFHSIDVEPVVIDLSILADRLERKVDPANLPLSNVFRLKKRYFK